MFFIYFYFTIDGKCEASGQTRKSKSTSVGQDALCNLQEDRKVFSHNVQTLLKRIGEQQTITHRGDLQDSSSIAELHRRGVDRGQSGRVCALPNQRPLEALQEQQSFHVESPRVQLLDHCYFRLMLPLSHWLPSPGRISAPTDLL